MVDRQLVESPSHPNFTVSIFNSVFDANSCESAGAVYIRNAPHTIGPNVTFSNNMAYEFDGKGGAIIVTTLVRGIERDLQASLIWHQA